MGTFDHVVFKVILVHLVHLFLKYSKAAGCRAIQTCLKETTLGNLRQGFMQNIWYFVSSYTNIFEIGKWNIYTSDMQHCMFTL